MANPASFLPGDAIINTLGIGAYGGTYDMLANYISVEIFESIFAPNVIATITVVDSLNVINLLNLQGNETVIINYGVPGLPTLNYSLALESISLENYLGSEKTKLIKFHCVGRETLVDKSLYIQKSYNTNISSIVSDIHSNFLSSSSPLETESTQGAQKIIIPSYKPFEAINMVRQRATSASNQDSNYTYFQNADGHHFVTIEGMMAKGIVKSFVHADALPTSLMNQTLNNIIDYEVPKFFSAVNFIDFGGIAQKTSQYDIRTRSYTTKTQSMGSSSPNFAGFGSGFNVFSFLPFDSASRGNTYLPQTTPSQMDSMAKLLQSYAVFKVYGDTNVQAGKTIYAAIPESVTTNQPQLDPVLSKNYLVSRIARYIGNVSTYPKYTETIEAIPTS